MPFNPFQQSVFSMGATCLPCCASSCPADDKLLLPPLTESSGTWYADCASADAVLTSNNVSNCVGFDDVGDTSSQTSFSFTATNGGSSLTLAHDAEGDGGIGPPGATLLPSMWCSVNLEAGESLTIAYSVSGTWGTGEYALASLYDYTGTLVDSQSNNTGSDLVFSSLPYTGRYIVSIVAYQDAPSDVFGSINASATLTSSGSFSANEIQALYDTGGASPSCLNCGDACP